MNELQLRQRALEQSGDALERERAIAGAEQELAQLREHATACPAELSQAVEKGIADATERCRGCN